MLIGIGDDNCQHLPSTIVKKKNTGRFGGTKKYIKIPLLVVHGVHVIARKGKGSLHLLIELYNNLMK